MLYGTYENFSLKIREIAALAFLPATEIEDEWLQLKVTIPDEVISAINYFDETYVRRKIRRILRGQEIRSPLFPSSLSSLHDRTELFIPRTQIK